MREICTSGSVGGEGGNILTYPALFDIVNKEGNAARERAAVAESCPTYFNALMPTCAICSSSCDCTPDTPIAPTHSF